MFLSSRPLIGARRRCAELLGSQAPELVSGIHSSTDVIHFDEIEAGGAGEPPLTACVIHGLLGAGKNLRTFCKSLQEKAESSGVRLKAVLVDQRNHGRQVVRPACC
jgi:hypothetical protein